MHNIFIGANAAASYTGKSSAHHIVAIGDGVVVPEDSPSFMLYVAGRAPRPLLHIDEETKGLIKREARTVMLSQERMGLPDFVPNPRHLSDAFWDAVIVDWNASVCLSMSRC